MRENIPEGVVGRLPRFDRPYRFCCVSQVFHMITSLHLHENSREVWIKVPSASLAFKRLSLYEPPTQIC